jgi:hypothetical protein
MASKVVSDRSDSLSPAAVAELEAMGLHRAGAARAGGSIRLPAGPRSPSGPSPRPTCSTRPRLTAPVMALRAMPGAQKNRPTLRWGGQSIETMRLR